MLSSVSHKVGKETIKLKLSTAALLRLEEEHDGRPFNSILEDILTGNGGVHLVVAAIAAAMNDGEGCDREEVVAFIDRAGGYRKLIPVLSKAVDVAFPEVKKAVDSAMKAAAAKAAEGQADAEDAAGGKATDPASA